MVGRGVLVGPRIRRRSKPRSPGRKRHRWHRDLDRQLLSREPSQDYRRCLPRTHDALTVGALSVGRAGAHDGTLDPLRTAARAKRRLCNTVGKRFIDGALRCCAVSTARSRAAATTNLARASLALVLRVIFGAPKSCALVNLFMICPQWSAGGRPRRNSAPDHGHLMANIRNARA